MKSHLTCILTSNDSIHFHLLCWVHSSYLWSELSDPVKGVTGKICQHDNWSFLIFIVPCPGAMGN